MRDLAPRSSARDVTSHLRVRYAETDQMGIVYYANYFVWFEVGRTDWLRSFGWSYQQMEADGFSLPAIDAQCEYRRPAHYDDELVVKTRADLLSPVRIAFRYEVARCADAVVAAVGRTVHAAIDGRGRPCRLPERVRMLFA